MVPPRRVERRALRTCRSPAMSGRVGPVELADRADHRVDLDALDGRRPFGPSTRPARGRRPTTSPTRPRCRSGCASAQAELVGAAAEVRRQHRPGSSSGTASRGAARTSSCSCGSGCRPGSPDRCSRTRCRRRRRSSRRRRTARRPAAAGARRAGPDMPAPMTATGNSTSGASVVLAPARARGGPRRVTPAPPRAAAGTRPCRAPPTANSMSAQQVVRRRRPAAVNRRRGNGASTSSARAATRVLLLVGEPALGLVDEQRVGRELVEQGEVAGEWASAGSSGGSTASARAATISSSEAVSGSVSGRGMGDPGSWSAVRHSHRASSARASPSAAHPAATRARVPSPLRGADADLATTSGPRGSRPPRWPSGSPPGGQPGRPRTSRTLGEIVRANVFTRFNAILGALLVVDPRRRRRSRTPCSASCSSPTPLIGIVQELRAKRTLDRLAVLNAPRPRVVRDGRRRRSRSTRWCSTTSRARTGDQMPGRRRRPQRRRPGDRRVAAHRRDRSGRQGAPATRCCRAASSSRGRARFQATAVGADAYAAQLAAEARRFTLDPLGAVDGINRILRVVSWVLDPGRRPAASGSQLDEQQHSTSGGGTVAGVVGMVPEGLVLLTSVAFVVGVVTPGPAQGAGPGAARGRGPRPRRRRVPRQDRHPHRGRDRVRRARAARGARRGREPALRARRAGRRPNPNATLAALGARLPAADGWTRDATVPFSSARKWSAATFDGHGDAGCWARPRWCSPTAAPDDDAPRAGPTSSPPAAGGCSCSPRRRRARRRDAAPRARARRAGDVRGQVAPRRRRDAALLRRAGRALKVISGDNPRTVAAVAARVGVPGADDAASTPASCPRTTRARRRARGAPVFGRVTPHQKRAMVGALQSGATSSR